MELVNSIIEFLNGIDHSLLLAINGWNAPWADTLMWWVSDRWVWVPFYVLLAGMVIRRFGWRNGLVVLLFTGALITLADQTCSHFLRPIFCRLRPANIENPISPLVHIVNDYRGGSYGFPSCHAANTFSLALFLSLCFANRRFTALMMAWSLLVCYSRSYLGVHYPGDLLFGASVGAFYAVALHRLLMWLLPRLDAMSRITLSGLLPRNRA